MSTSTSTTLSVRLDPNVKVRLEKLAQRTKRSKSFLAAEAIASYVEAEDWQLEEIAAGLAELDSGRMVEHEKVVKWLRSWGKPSEGAPPR
jgi:RHH-type transcriptional regulator, rel operon repressor / antitoxin RelB